MATDTTASLKSPPDKPLCFVVQGFGSKTDYTDGRVLDLDASYDVIKQAVERAGLRCQRADEIVHSGTIDIPMYEQLLEAAVEGVEVELVGRGAAGQALAARLPPPVHVKIGGRQAQAVEGGEFDPLPPDLPGALAVAAG